jgi:hypothetical protein
MPHSRRRTGSILAKLLVAVGIVAGVIMVIIVLFMMTGGTLHEASPPMKSRNNLAQIVFALHSYEVTFGHLPPAAVRDKSDKPLLSWRLAIAPYLEADDVYRKIHFDEPWDSTHNLQFVEEMPRAFRSPGAQPPNPGMTFYRVFVGPGTAFETDGLCRTEDFPNGTANTIAVVEAGRIGISARRAAAATGWSFQRPVLPGRHDERPPTLL